MALAEAIGRIEGCDSLDQLRAVFQSIIESYGFASFAFVEVGRPEQVRPFAIPSDDKKWVADYVGNDFLLFDPIIPVVRRSNLPFRWSDLPPPVRTGKRKSGAYRTMEAALDHGFSDGFVIPVHFVDRLGRPSSASCVLFWRDLKSKLLALLVDRRSELRVLATYFAQEVVGLLLRGPSQLVAGEDAHGAALTDRERVSLEWAARGKTAAETAEILGISHDTVEQHLRSAMRKLGAVNKTQAAVLAVKVGLIDL